MLQFGIFIFIFMLMMITIRLHICLLTNYMWHFVVYFRINQSLTLFLIQMVCILTFLLPFQIKFSSQILKFATIMNGIFWYLS